MSNEQGDVILNSDGKPLTGKALKKARRAAQVAARSTGNSQKNQSSNSTQRVPEVQSSNPEEKPEHQTDQKPAYISEQNASTEQTVPKSPKITAETPQTAPEQIFLDPKTGKPLTGKALKKMKRAALVEQRGGPINTQHQQNIQSPQNIPKQHEITKKVQPQKSNPQKQNIQKTAPQKTNQQKLNKPQQKGAQNQQKQPPRQQKPVFTNIRKEFNFTDSTQMTINDALCKQAKEMESASPQQPQVLKIGKDSLKLTNSVHPEFINFGLKVCSNERAFSSTQRACLEFCLVFIRYAETFDHLKFSSSLKRTDFCAAMIEDLKNQLGFLRLCTSF